MQKGFILHLYDVMWCIFMSVRINVVAKGKQPAKPKRESKSMRTSVSFPRELYETLERMAKGKKVSVAWIVRDAAEKYVGDQWPLFDDKGKGA